MARACLVVCPDTIMDICTPCPLQLMARVQPALGTSRARDELGDEEWHQLQAMIAGALRAICPRAGVVEVYVPL